MPRETKRHASAPLAFFAAAGVLLWGARAAAAEREPSRAAVKAAIETIEGIDNFLILKGTLASKHEVELGRILFSDTRLSQGNVMSCATCHVATRAYSDGLPRSRGRGGKELLRNAVPLKNTALDPHYLHGLFRDGRAATLEDAAQNVFREPLEFATTPMEMAATLASDENYVRRFKELYGSNGATAANAAKALGTFIESLTPTQMSPYDRVLDDWQVLSPSQKRGLVLFAGKARCVHCHYGPDLTGAEVLNIGLKPRLKVPDNGRYEVTHAPSDLRAFKTPTLRNVAITGPYRHDGSVATLAKVIEFYDRGGDLHEGQSARIRALHLSAGEKRDLEAFLHSLTHPGEPGDPPNVASAPPPERSANAGAALSPYWDVSFEISSYLEKAQSILDTLEGMRRPWTQRPEYSGPACLKRSTPDALVAEDSQGRFSSEEQRFLGQSVYDDLIAYYRARAYAKTDFAICAKLGYQGSEFISHSGHYQCRNWYLEMSFTHAMFTKPANFMNICNALSAVDLDSLRYKPLCPTIHENLDDIDTMCAKLAVLYILPTSVRSCKTLFSPINAAPIDCSRVFRNKAGSTRCRDYRAFTLAWRAKDIRQCGASEGCEVLMGNGEAVAERSVARIKAKLCASDPERPRFVEQWQKSAAGLIDDAQRLLEKAIVTTPGVEPAPSEAHERLEEIAQLRQRLRP